MTQLSLAASCLADLRAERAHLAGLLTGVTDLPGTDDWQPADCAVLAWARSGLMHLTGLPGGATLAPHAPALPRAQLIASAIAALTADRGQPVRLDVAHLLAHRAALQGWQRQGSTSANGTCRILRAVDGWAAVNLSRPTDVLSVPAVLGHQVRTCPWEDLARSIALMPAADVTAAAQLVGIPAAALGGATPRPVRFCRLGQPGQAPPLVLDLSAMWAGPLCARILHQAGWHVLKVEDSRRPDGARWGPAAFYRSLHDGIPAVRLDFGTSSGRAELARLAAHAGIVLESSRPRALQRLGLVAADWLGGAEGRVWVSVTGYGRDDPSQRVAFGDDAAVAGGLVAWTEDHAPVFCGDAIADPITGMLSALAALAASAAGGGWLVDVAMAGACADLVRPASGPEHTHLISRDGAGWSVLHGDSRESVRGW